MSGGKIRQGRFSSFRTKATTVEEKCRDGEEVARAKMEVRP